MTTLEAIELFKSKSPHELTMDELVALREVFEKSPAILGALGGREEVEAYLASAEEALASGEAEGDAEDPSESERESEEDVPDEAHSGLGKHAGELLLALVVVVAVGWWLGTRFLAMKEELIPIAERVAEDEGKDEDEDEVEDAASDHSDRKAGDTRSKKAKPKTRRKKPRRKRPWEAWKITRGESTKIHVDDDWDLSDQANPRRLQVLRTQGGPITLSRTEKFLPEHRWLMVDARPDQFMATQGTISVRIDGDEAAVIAIGNGATLLPVYIEIPPGEPRKVTLAIEFTPGEPEQRVAWWSMKPVVEQQIEPRPTSPLAAKLLSDDPSARRQAAIQAVKATDGFITEALIHALNDEDTSVRKEVASAIFKRDDLASKEALREAMATHKEFDVRLQIAGHLVKNPDPQAEASLVKALASGDQTLAVTAVSALSKLTSDRADAVLAQSVRHADVKVARAAADAIYRRENDAAEAAMLAALKDHPDLAVRRTAAKRYESLPTPNAVDPLRAALASEDDPLRQQAIKSLGRIEDAKSTAALIGALENKDPKIRALAVGVFYNRQDDATEAAMLAAINGNADIQVRRLAARRFELLPSPNAVDPLRAALAAEDDALRQQAIRSLGKIEDPKSTAALIGALQNKDPKIRHQVAKAFYNRRDNATEAAMLAAINGHPDIQVRLLAMRRFESLPSPNAVDPIRAILVGEDVGLWQQAIKSLGRIRSPKSTATLVEALQSKNSRIRVHAAKAFYIRRDDATEAAMLAAIDGHPDIEVRRLAARRFELLPTLKAVDPLRAALAGEDAALRKQAAKSLARIKKADPGPPPKKSLAKGQFVQVRLEGDKRVLCLAEVQVHRTGDGAELHRAGKASQSSVLGNWGPHLAIDGNLAQILGKVTHTRPDDNAFWLLDLGGVKDIGRIKVFSRGSRGGGVLNGAIVEVLDPKKKVLYTATITGAEDGSVHEFVAK